jgi:ribonuclease HI
MTKWMGKWLENGWVNTKGLEVANRDLLEADELDDELRTLRNVTYKWIPRHQNTEADRYCNEALDEDDSDQRMEGVGDLKHRGTEM